MNNLDFLGEVSSLGRTVPSFLPRNDHRHLAHIYMELKLKISEKKLGEKLGESGRWKNNIS